MYILVPFVADVEKDRSALDTTSLSSGTPTSLYDSMCVPEIEYLGGNGGGGYAAAQNQGQLLPPPAAPAPPDDHKPPSSAVPNHRNTAAINNNNNTTPYIHDGKYHTSLLRIDPTKLD